MKCDLFNFYLVFILGFRDHFRYTTPQLPLPEISSRDETCCLQSRVFRFPPKSLLRMYPFQRTKVSIIAVTKRVLLFRKNTAVLAALKQSGEDTLSSESVVYSFLALEYLGFLMPNGPVVRIAFSPLERDHYCSSCCGRPNLKVNATQKLKLSQSMGNNEASNFYSYNCTYVQKFSMR